MKIDNRLSLERMKRAISPKIIALALLVSIILSVVLYVTLENIKSKELLIWYVTEESTNCFSNDSLVLVDEYVSKNGINKVVLKRLHPDDTYFDVAMSTSAYYNCDIFIMKAEMVKDYVELDIFSTLSVDRFDQEAILFIEENAVGVLISDDYYLLINAKTDIDIQMIYDIFDILARKK
jgi:hypothetical protein